jgi:hypothetical protein
MNINIINAPTILIEEGTKAVTLRSIFFLPTVKHIGFFSLFYSAGDVEIHGFVQVFNQMITILSTPTCLN